MLMIPEAWVGNALMDEDRRARSTNTTPPLMEPWDGPAAMAFTNGRQIGCHAGPQRPAPGALRGHDDDMIVMASEVGVLTSPKKNRQEVAPAARQDAAARSGAGPHR